MMHACTRIIWMILQKMIRFPFGSRARFEPVAWPRSLSSAAMEAKLVRFYQKYAPEKASNAATVLKTFEGREAELCSF